MSLSVSMCLCASVSMSLNISVSRWASHGLEFLLVACEPRGLATLSDHEFAVRYWQSYERFSLFLCRIIW